ncbi:MAG: hypothetical protein AAF376_13950 [Pseudomonadota bacterium]
MLLAVGLIALALTVGSLVRIATQTDNPAGDSLSGLYTLTDQERLVLFEDYSFDAGGWSDLTITRERPEFGSVLGPIAPGTALTRTLDLPPETSRVIIEFEVQAWDAAEPVDLAVRVDGEPVADGGPVVVVTEDRADGRTQVQILHQDPGDSVDVSLSTSNGSGDWVLDNLVTYARMAQEE